MARKILAEFDAADGPFISKMRAIDASINRFQNGTLNAFGRVEKGIDGILGGMNRLSTLGAAVGIGFSVNLAAHFIDTATKIRNSLKQAGDDSQAAFDKTFQASVRSLASFDDMAEGVARFQKILGDSQTFDQSLRQIETLNKLLALGSKSAEERASTMLQFTQALQSGVLQGDELRSLRESAPVELLRALATQAGGTLDQLKALGAEGKITSDVMVRALDSLAASADERMGQVKVSIADAAQQMRNGAVVAAEAFDKGLGLSRTGVAGLQALGKALGENGEAFEQWGQIAKVAAEFIGATYLGRRAQEGGNALKAFYAAQTTGVQATYDASAKVLTMETATTASKQKATAAIRLKVQALQTEGASEAKVAVAMAQLTRAEIAETAARERLVAATNAATAAQTRLSGAARIAAASGTVLKSAWAFIGGWPGLLLIAGTALLTFSSTAESAIEKMDRMRGVTDTARAAADTLRDVQDRLKTAMEQTGNVGSEASRKIVAGTLQELRVQRDLLAFKTEALESVQQERMGNLNDQEAKVALLQQQMDDVIANDKALGRLAGSGDPYLAQNLEEARGVLLQLRADAIDAQNAIDANNALLASSAAQIVSGLFDASGAAEKLVGWLDGAADASDRIAGSDPSSPISAAAGWAKSLFEWLSAAARVVLPGSGGSDGSAPPLTGPAGMGQSPPSGGAVSTSIRPGQRDINFDPTPGTGSSGGGGGSSKTDDSQKEALAFIEQMLTAQERQAKQLADMLALREKIVATYGAESPLVGQMDTAIGRLKDQMNGLTEAQQQFWDTLSQSIVSNTEEWKGWGNFVKSLLASLVSSYGKDFFTALLTPGKQSGGGLGTVLGNLLTGGLGTALGGAGKVSLPGIGQAKVASVTRMASLDMAPLRQAIGSRSDGAFHYAPTYDFRGADQSVIPRLKAELAKRDRELPGKVIDAVREARKRRIDL